jgi:hypothetical protein
VLQVFYCNRPTVAALMALGADLAAVNAVLYPAPLPEQVSPHLFSPRQLASNCWHAH